MDSQTPFSQALKRVQDRRDSVSWTPTKKEGGVAIAIARLVPSSLQELAMTKFASDISEIATTSGSMEGVVKYIEDQTFSIRDLPHHLLDTLIDQLWGETDPVKIEFLRVLVTGSPKEIRVVNGFWLTESQIECFQNCDTAELRVLQMEFCDSCMIESAIPAVLAKKQLPQLNILSLRGSAYLEDQGLKLILGSCQKLESINLSICPQLTSEGVAMLTGPCRSTLKELYLDECSKLTGKDILSSLKNLECLEVLSIAGIGSVDDDFIMDYTVARGLNLKGLSLRDCRFLTDVSVKAISEHCPRLHTLDIGNLIKLSDLSFEFLTNSCQAMRTLKLEGNPISDEVIAAFLEVKGSCLLELSLDSMEKVGQHTTLSLANCTKLHTLNLPRCVNMRDLELGFIVDKCRALRSLTIHHCCNKRFH